MNKLKKKRIRERRKARVKDEKKGWKKEQV